jgi:farnesyl diphosphate synthase
VSGNSNLAHPLTDVRGSDLRIFMINYQNLIQNLLDKNLPNSNSILHQAMRYSILNGGKRLRSLLVYAAGKVVNADSEKLDNVAIAIECIHAYSLIHDDLPAMDNDDYRRGILSCHKKFDEATAILAGDALQSFAFEILARNENISQIILLAKSIGAEGMCLGQSEDMNYKNQKIDHEKLYEIHQYKTGKLITASVQLGAMCAHRDDKAFQILTDYANNFGLAFQLRDDLADGDYSKEEYEKVKEEADLYFNLAKQKLELLSECDVSLFQKIEEMLNAKS